MGSGCGDLIADTGPSSATQLPILAALHARSPTLFEDYHTILYIKCKSPFYNKSCIFMKIKYISYVLTV